MPRPRSVTLLALLVLFIAGFNVLSLAGGVQRYTVLASLPLRLPAVVTIVSAAFWAAAFGLLLLLCVGLSQPLTRFTGAGLWAWRTAALLAVLILLAAALGALFSSTVRPQYALGLVLLGVAAGLSAARPRFFDVAVLSAVALGLDALLVAGLGRWLFDSPRQSGEPIMELLLIGGAAAVLLALSVQQVMRLARRNGVLA